MLPGTLEEFELEAHARDLLSIPRVVALEPSRVRTPRLMRNAVSMRQARRLRLPGRLRLVVLYHPAQYPLARALVVEHEEAELWYLPPDAPAVHAVSAAERAELIESDELARQHASRTLAVLPDGGVDDAPLRERLRELDVINPRPFVPGRAPQFGRARKGLTRPR
jgi:hypothetical protein